MSSLVIVESPAKAKTLSQILGKGYRVEASYGHIRDLPGSAEQIPSRLKAETWARLGVNVENHPRGVPSLAGIPMTPALCHRPPLRISVNGSPA